VTLRIVDTIPRQSTGKTRRFIPLTPKPAGELQPSS
jgi:hypothetical protein